MKGRRVCAKGLRPVSDLPFRSGCGQLLSGWCRAVLLSFTVGSTFVALYRHKRWFCLGFQESRNEFDKGWAVVTEERRVLL